MILLKKHRDKWFAYKGWTAKYIMNFEDNGFSDVDEAIEFCRQAFNEWIDVQIGSHIGHLMTVEDWIGTCEMGGFIDYDGFGSLVLNDELIDDNPDGWVYPSKRNEIDYQGATHILWYNN